MTDPDNIPESGENHLIAERRAKLKKLREHGNAFPNDFRRDALAADLLTAYGEKAAEGLETEPIRVAVAGRMRVKRVMGKASFAKIEDSSGSIQVFLQQQTLGDTYDEFKTWDVGDVIGAQGALFRTKTGELSVRVDRLVLLTKSLRPLPDKWHGIADTEMRYRRRYVDLIMNEETRRVFETRSRIVRYLRAFLDARGFLEVETPMLHPIPGGAAARPFKTHHNALDVDMYLRIAPELYLKRLTVGGFERVYEINRNFRNEGVSTQHNPEFTMLELYCAYGDLFTIMELTEALVVACVDAINVANQPTHDESKGEWQPPNRTIPWGEKTVAFTPPFQRAKYADLFRAAVGCDMTDTQAVKAKATEFKIHTTLKDEKTGTSVEKEHDVLVNDLFGEVVEPTLVGPMFVYDYPAELCPLTKRKPNEPGVAERFELYVHGMELANAYTELNDPITQEATFRQQLTGMNDEDSMAKMDDDFVRALRHGMPPAGGLGIGIDRLAMLLTDTASIRDIILFPLLRPLALTL